MRGNELIRLVKKLGRERAIPVLIDATRGKGSHATLHYGDRHAIVPNPKHELKKGTLHAILGQLGLRRDDLR